MAVTVRAFDRETSSTSDVAFESSTASTTRYVGSEEQQSRTVASIFRPGQGGPNVVDNPGKYLRQVHLTERLATLQEFTDASLADWESHLNFQTVRGKWNAQEMGLHINVQEMFTVLEVLKHFL